MMNPLGHPVRGKLRTPCSPPKSRTFSLRIASLLAASIIPVCATPQSLATHDPVGDGLAGSTVARTESPWHALRNPASPATERSRTVLTSFSPAHFGRPDWFEGSAILSLPVSSDLAIAGTCGRFSAGSYTETRLTGIAAVSISDRFSVGTGLSFISVGTESYEPLTAFTLDLGVHAAIAEGLLFGAAISNATRSRIGDDAPLQRLAVGVAYSPDTSLTLSLDGRQDLGDPLSIALGLSWSPLDDLTLRAGAGHKPGLLSIGIGYRISAVSVDVAGTFTSPLGLRYAVGAGIDW